MKSQLITGAAALAVTLAIVRTRDAIDPSPWRSMILHRKCSPLCECHRRQARNDRGQP